MIVSDLDLVVEPGVARAQARIAWEDCDRPPFLFFVETTSDHRHILWPDPNALLTACLLPAWRAGERRLRIEGALCPMLLDNARAATSVIEHWFPGRYGAVPAIEPTEGVAVLRPSRPRALSLLSCGIDSLATLRWNRVHIPPGHPASIGGVIMVSFHGEPSSSPFTGGRFSVASEIAADAGAEWIPVRTSMRCLSNHGYFFDEQWHGAVLSSIASCFSRGFDRVSIASSYTVEHLHPWGSHPLLDPCYSSAHFRAEHHGLWMTRFEKTALIAEWPAALDRLVVCQSIGFGEQSSNCGACEKCIRTMTALAALGKLEGCRAFPRQDIDAQLLGTVEEYDMFHADSQVSWYEELIPPLERGGRDDLADTIRKLLAYAGRKSSHESWNHSGST